LQAYKTPGMSAKPVVSPTNAPPSEPLALTMTRFTNVPMSHRIRSALPGVPGVGR
jgi:hypothetical protein